ncbi:hypothetical protein I203_107131 [Kwoniella mangroviensis CBS 8507]|uniref:hypothetical protein n=1 Tax=Kwoniella mangroviensis CBS 8507 TaxID=1296122 RepID=UPI0030617123
MSGDNIQKEDNTSLRSQQTETETSESVSDGHGALAVLALNLTDSQVDQTIFRYQQLRDPSNTDVMSRIEELLREALTDSRRNTDDESGA